MYVQVEGQPGVIRARRQPGGPAGVDRRPDPLRDRNLLKVSAGKSVDGLDVLPAGQPPDKPIKLRRRRPRVEAVRRRPGDPQKADDATVSRIVDALSAKRTHQGLPRRRTPRTSPRSPRPSTCGPTGSTRPAPTRRPSRAKKAEPTKLEFGRRDGETVYVRRTLPGQTAPSEFALSARSARRT